MENHKKSENEIDSRNHEAIRVQKTNRSKKYLIYFIFIISQFAAFRSFTIDGPKTTALVWYFFPHLPFDVGLYYLSFFGFFAGFGSFLSIFIQKLSDKYGRKPILIFTSIIITVVPLVQFLTDSLEIFMISAFFLNMAVNTNVWMIYVNEESPKGQNAAWTTMIQLFSGYGPILFYVIRPYFITNDKIFTITNWKGILIPSIISGVILTVIIFFTVKESSAFVYKKLKSSDGVENNEKSSVSFFRGVKIIFNERRRKPYTVLLIIAIMFTIGIGSGNLLEPYLMTQSLVTSDEFSLISIVSLIGNGFFLVMTGKIADKFGRKILLVCYSILYPISVILQFTWGAHIPNEHFRIIIMIILKFFGMSTRGAIWTLLMVISIELVPTEVRGIANSMLALSMNITGMISGLITASLLPILGIQIPALIVSGFIFIIIPLVIKFIPQSHGLDLKQIK